VLISQGRLRDALRASCAIPFVFRPVQLGDRSYVDGGVTDNCSISTAARMEPEHIIAVDLTAEPAMPALRRLSEVFERMTSVALHSACWPTSTASATPAGDPDLSPHRQPAPSADFARVREAARAAMESTPADRRARRRADPAGPLYLPISMEGSRPEADAGSEGDSPGDAGTAPGKRHVHARCDGRDELRGRVS